MNFDDGPWTKCVLGLKGDTSMPVFHRRRTSRCKYEVKLTEKKNDWAKEMGTLLLQKWQGWHRNEPTMYARKPKQLKRQNCSNVQPQASQATTYFSVRWHQLLNRPSKYKPLGGLVLGNCPQTQSKTKKNGKFPSKKMASPIDFLTQISLHP